MATCGSSNGATIFASQSWPFPHALMIAFTAEYAGGEVTIDAEHVEYDQRANVITARGAVKITRGDMVLTADTVKVNRTTQVADAQGNVVGKP